MTLRAHDRPDGILVLFDTRPFAPVFELRLHGWERTVYLFCDTARSFPQILSVVHETDPSVDEVCVRRTLGHWIDVCIMSSLDHVYLSLALVAWM